MQNAIEQQVIQLRQEGMSYENIIKATGLPERKVKLITKGVSKPEKAKKVVVKIPTPLAKSVNRVFALASRVQGIRDYELRDIMHEEYGCTWDTEKGKYRSNYNEGTLKRVRAKVRERAVLEDCNVIFVMDWADEEKPTAGRLFLEDAATDLMARIEGYVEQYMECHGSRREESGEEAVLARRKQRYAAENHLLKLAIKGLSKEPLEALLERSVALTNALEGSPDVPLSVSGALAINESGTADTKIPGYFPEPSRANPFLDYVESQGWLKEMAHRFV